MVSALKKLVVFLFLAELMLLPILYSTGNLMHLFNKKLSHQFRISRRINEESVTNLFKVSGQFAASNVMRRSSGLYEVKIKGQLYDIIRMERAGKDVVLYCHHDGEEEEYDADIERTSSQINDSPSKKERTPVRPVLPFSYTEELNIVHVSDSYVSDIVLPGRFIAPHCIVYHADCFSPPEKAAA